MLTVWRRVSVLGIVVALLVVVSLSQGLGARPTTMQDAATPDAMGMIALGGEIYNNTCIACHQPAGEGVEGYYPALAGNPFVTLEDPNPVIQTVLAGRGGMPAFRNIYSDEEIAAVVSYVRQAWENDAGPVSPEQVGEIRAEVEATPVPDAGTPVVEGTPGGAAEPRPEEGTPTDPSG